MKDAISEQYVIAFRAALRINHTRLDDEIKDIISAARADLQLEGIRRDKVCDEDDPLIKRAISAYVKAEFGLDNADAPKFCPGVYTASILLDGNPVDIQVTVDSSNINSIELVNLSESITTMYPKLTTSFDEVASKVMEAGTTNITYDSANRYTYSVFIEAISAALKKAAP